MAKRRKIIDSIFSEILTFDRIECRTTRSNEVYIFMVLFYNKSYVFFLVPRCELLGTKFEPFTRRFPDFKRVNRGLKMNAFDFLNYEIKSDLNKTIDLCSYFSQSC